MKYLLLASLVLFVLKSNAQDFIKVTTGPAVNDNSQSYGASFVDFDEDGDMDLFVVNFTNSSNLLFENDGSGNFSTLVSPPITGVFGSSLGHSWVDIDLNCYNDLYISNGGANGNQTNQLLLNNNGQYTQQSSSIVVTSTSNSQTSNWGDYDNDGDLDLFIANLYGENNLFFINDGTGNFTQNTSSVISSSGGSSNDANWVDIDNDGDLDLFVANQGNEKNFLYQNNGGNFSSITTGAIVNDQEDSYGSVWGDYDNDGDLDLYVCNAGGTNSLYRNDGGWTFTKVTTGPHVNDFGTSYGASWVDYDNDGFLDLFIANSNSENNQLYKNNNGTSFSAITTGAIVNDGGVSRSCTFADIDNDGDLDCYVTNRTYSNNFLYKNNIGTNKNWLHVDLKATTSNTNCIGAVVKLKATIGGTPVWQMREVASKAGYCAQESPTLEFGLNNTTNIDSLIVYWPTSNTTNYYTNVAANQKMQIYESDNALSATAIYDTLCYSNQQNLSFDGNIYNWFSDSLLSDLLVQDSVLDVSLTSGDTVFYLESIVGGICLGDLYTYKLHILEAPQLDLGNDTLICSGDTLNLAISLSNSNTQITWHNGSSNSSISVSQPGAYWVTLEKNGCENSDTITIDFYNLPFTPTLLDTTTCDNAPYFLTLPSQNHVNYTWSNGDAGLNFSSFTAGTYTLSVDHPCYADTTSFDLAFEDCSCNCDCFIFIPNTFTPDGNEHNPNFRAEHDCNNIKLFHLQIYNRTGILIFESYDSHAAWDGTYMGKRVKDGVYVYVLNYELETGVKETKTGHINLLR